MEGYTRVEIIKELRDNRNVLQKFKTDEQFKGWCNRNLTEIKQKEKIEPINTEGMKYINEDWKDKEYYSKSDKDTMYKELRNRFDNLGQDIQLFTTEDIANILKDKGITYKNSRSASARVSQVAKSLEIKPYKSKGKFYWYTREDTEKIVNKLVEEHRHITPNDEDEAVKELQSILDENRNLNDKLEDAKIIQARQKIQIEERDEKISNLVEKTTSQQIKLVEMESDKQELENKVKELEEKVKILEQRKPSKLVSMLLRRKEAV